MKSVRGRLLAGLIALVIVLDGAAGLLSYERAQESTATILDYQLRQMALSLRDQGIVAPALQARAANQDFDFIVQIWGEDGAMIYESRTDLPFAREAVLGYADVALGQERWRVYALQTERGVIQVGQRFQVREQLARDVALRTVAPLLVLAPLLAIAIWWIVVRTLAPIQRVVGEVRLRGIDSLAPVPAHGLPQEIEPLVAALNRLMDRLASAFQAQRSFIADAAHELRSPLTALRLQLQLLERATDEPSRQLAREKLAEAMQRASVLVQQLLALARSEAGSLAPAAATLDFTTLVREGVADCAPLAIARGIELTLDAAESLTLTGDAEALRALVRNLVDNAVRYTPSGGRIQVRLGRTADALALDVEDSGPGIPAAEREQVFGRFYRGSSANEGGSGLGLAIVQAVTRRHHGTVTLGDSPLGGLKASVRFPLRWPTLSTDASPP